MLFAITCTDKPGALELRMATRPAHLEYVARHAMSLVLVGPLLTPEGTPAGSLFIVDLPDRAAAEAFAAGDPYAGAGLFESTVIRPFRTVYKDGAAVPA